MTALVPKGFEGLTECSQRMDDLMIDERTASSIPELLLFRQLQEEWNHSNDDLIAA